MELSTNNAGFVIAAYAIAYIGIEGLAFYFMMQRFKLRRLLNQERNGVDKTQ